MGWGDDHAASSAPPVRERMAADTLAQVVAAFLAARTGTNEERMGQALESYRDARWRGVTTNMTRPN